MTRQTSLCFRSYFIPITSEYIREMCAYTYMFLSFFYFNFNYVLFIVYYYGSTLIPNKIQPLYGVLLFICSSHAFQLRSRVCVCVCVYRLCHSTLFKGLIFIYHAKIKIQQLLKLAKMSLSCA